MISASDALMLSNAAKEASDKAYTEKIKNLTLCRIHTAIADGRTSVWVDCHHSRLEPFLNELRSAGYSLILMPATVSLYSSTVAGMEVSWG